jgi:hypothetical protein
MMIPIAAATRRPTLLGNSSGQTATDHVLHVQRLTLPLGLNTSAQPRLGRRPPPATAGHRADERTPPATSPRRPGRAAPDPGSTGPPPTPGSGPAGTGPGRRPARRHGPTRPAWTGPDRWLGTAHVLVPRVQPSLAAQECDSVCSGESACPSSSPLGTAIIERPVLPKATAASPTMIPPKYRPTLSSTRSLHDPPMARPMLHPWCIAVVG